MAGLVPRGAAPQGVRKRSRILTSSDDEEGECGDAGSRSATPLLVGGAAGETPPSGGDDVGGSAAEALHSVAQLTSLLQAKIAEAERLRSHLESLEQLAECCICLENPVSHAFRSCAHPRCQKLRTSPCAPAVRVLTLNTRAFGAICARGVLTGVLPPVPHRAGSAQLRAPLLLQARVRLGAFASLSALPEPRAKQDETVWTGRCLGAEWPGPWSGGSDTAACAADACRAPVARHGPGARQGARGV